MSVKAGTYQCKIGDSYGIGETKAGHPFVAVNLKLKDGELVHTMQWSGYVHSEKSLEITNKALAAMGMATPDFAAIAEGKGLDGSKVFYCTVVEETTDKGMIYSKVAWINESDSKGKTAMLDKSAALLKLKGLGLVSGTSSTALPF